MVARLGRVNRAWSWLMAKTTGAVGGPARFRVVLILALVVGLQGADTGTVGALVVPLKRALDIDNTQVGLLVTVSTGVGAVVTLFAGALTDHVIRVRLLWISIVLWSAATALCGVSFNYAWLLSAWVALGAMVAVPGPVVASLVGDFFPAKERGRMYGFVLTGEGVCTAAGLFVSGELGAVSWRLGFWLLSVLGLVLAVAVVKKLPEPARGGASRVPIGATRLITAEDVEHGRSGGRGKLDDRDGAGETADESGNVVTAEVAEHGVRPHSSRVLHENPRDRSLWWAVRYILSIRTNVVLVIASSLGYFFYTGLSTFGTALLRSRFDVGQALATLLAGTLGVGALIGVLSNGRIADWLTARGRLSARMTMAGVAFLVAGCFAVPTLLTDNLAVAMVFGFLAGIGLGGANPPLDAGRLDIMHSRLWGRAEAVRTALRSIATGLAPLVFGFVSTQLGGSSASAVHRGGNLGGSAARAPSGAAAALDHTFLIMLGPLFVAAALVLLIARRTFARDVATALASERADYRSSS